MIPNRAETLRRLRLGNLQKLFRHRYGPVLPDDDAGRDDLYELLLPISVGPHAEIKMPKAIEVWAPWMKQDEAEALIDRVNRTPIWDRKPDSAELGRRLRVTNAEPSGHAATVLPTNAMIPPPHGFACRGLHRV
jgi:hypothetical protein